MSRWRGLLRAAVAFHLARVSPDAHALLTALSDQAEVAALDAFPLWRDATPQSLDSLRPHRGHPHRGRPWHRPQKRSMLSGLDAFQPALSAACARRISRDKGEERC